MRRFITYKTQYRLFLFTIDMTVASRFDYRVRVLLHSLGLSCIGGAIFLQILVFTDIAQHGYFIAVEHNPAVLTFEIILTAFALIYFIYAYQRFIRSARSRF